MQACVDTCSVRYVTPDVNGNWTADFSGADGSSLTTGVGGWITQSDENSNQSQINWQIKPPHIEVSLDGNFINTYNWPSGTVTLSIDDPLTTDQVDYSAEDTMDTDSRDSVYFNLGMFTLQPGHILTVSGGGVERIYTIANLTVTGFDLNADTISGTGRPGEEIQMQACTGTICGMRDVTPGANGTWTVDYNGFDGVDLVPGASGQAFQRDINGNQIWINWQAATPHVEASLDGDFVDVYALPSGLVTLTIDDPLTTEQVDYSAEGAMGSKPWESVRFNLGLFDLKPGHVLNVSGGNFQRAYTVADLAVTGFDLDANIVSGTGTPGEKVQVQACSGMNCGMRSITVNGSGLWTANYSGLDGVDLISGASGSSIVGNANEDRTWLNWQVNNPRIEASLADNFVNIYDWPSGTVTLKINDPSTTTEIDHSVEGTMGSSLWSFAHFSLDPFVLKPGHILTISGGGVERTYAVANLVVTSFDLNADTISGTGTLGKNVQVQVCVEITCETRSVTSDMNGKWIADFSGSNGLNFVLGASDIIIEGGENENQTWTSSSKFSNNFVSGNVGVPGATLSYMNGIAKTAISDVDGNYLFTVPSYWSGTVTPSKTGYTFTPASKDYSNVTVDKSGENYTATLNTYSISGNAGIGGTTITYTGGSTTANVSGNYTFTVPHDWSGTVTPSKAGYTFSQVNKSYTNVTADQTAQNYTAALNPPVAFNKSTPANGVSNQSTSPTLFWSASSDATSYEYCYDTTNDNACSTWVNNGVIANKTLSGLKLNTTYYWQVRAVNSGGPTYANSETWWSFKVTRQELTKNGGFNAYTGTSKVPTSWVKSSNFATTDGKNITIMKEGTASVKFVGASGKAKTLSQTLNVSGPMGKPFTFSYYVTVSSLPITGLCQAQVTFYNGSTSKGTKTLKCPTGKTYDWKQAKLNFTAPAAYTKIIIKFTYSKTSGLVWFDLVSLTR